MSSAYFSGFTSASLFDLMTNTSSVELHDAALHVSQCLKANPILVWEYVYCHACIKVIIMIHQATLS